MRILINCPISPEFKACSGQLNLSERIRFRAKHIHYGRIGEVKVYAVHSGAGRNRAVDAVEKAVLFIRPDLVLDTGACASLEEGIGIGTVILATRCVETGDGDPLRPHALIRKREVTAGLNGRGHEGAAEGLHGVEKTLSAAGIETARGVQGCGKFMVRSREQRRSLNLSLGVIGWNWETSGVFDGACKTGIPGMSLRIVTDMGDERAVGDFFRHIRPEAERLYQAIRKLIEKGLLQSMLAPREGKNEERVESKIPRE